MSSQRFFAYGEMLQVPKGFVAVVTASGIRGHPGWPEKPYFTGYLMPADDLSLDFLKEPYISPFDGKLK